MKKPHARVTDHLEMARDQIDHWIDILGDLTDAEPNIAFEARAYMRGAAGQLKEAEKAIRAALNVVEGNHGADIPTIPTTTANLNLTSQSAVPDIEVDA